MQRIHHFLKPLDRAALLFLPQLAAAPLLFPDLLGLAKRVHRLLEFFFESQNFFLFVLQFPVAVRCQKVDGPLLFGQLRLLGPAVILHLLLEHLLFVRIGSLDLLLPGIILKAQFLLHILS